jgi:hypothetical protein
MSITIRTMKCQYQQSMVVLLLQFWFGNNDNQPHEYPSYYQIYQHHVLLPYFCLLDGQDHYTFGFDYWKTDHHKQEVHHKPLGHQMPIQNDLNYFLKSVQLLFLTLVTYQTNLVHLIQCPSSSLLQQNALLPMFPSESGSEAE